MSLKEEIYEYMLGLTKYYERYSLECDKIAKEYTDEVVSKIEKRIEIVKEKKDDHNYSGEEDFYDGFSLGFDHAIEKLEEMLK